VQPLGHRLIRRPAQIVHEGRGAQSVIGQQIHHHHGKPCARGDENDVAFRGSAPSGPGFWMAPTVLETSDPSSRSFQEEIFGPVVSVIRFSDEDEAIRIANDSPFGLSGSIWSRDIGRALRVARGVETGALSVNSNSSVRYSTPFGGFKQSGIGRELGPDALLGFSEEKNVFISTEES